jgi:hypothetical protein
LGLDAEVVEADRRQPELRNVIGHVVAAAADGPMAANG